MQPEPEPPLLSAPVNKKIGSGSTLKVAASGGSGSATLLCKDMDDSYEKDILHIRTPMYDEQSEESLSGI